VPGAVTLEPVVKEENQAPPPAPSNPLKIERALVISAHPDDPEFGFGGAIAKLTAEGVEVNYVICTDGSQGGEDPSVSDADLSSRRYLEQRAAADVLGVKEITFLGIPDGHLFPDLDLRRQLVREIRRYRPELVMTHSPVRNLGAMFGASHPDHLAVGETAMAAVYPDSRNPRAFRELLEEGFAAHRVREVWFGGLTDPDHVVDVSEYAERKLKAILCHQSQFEKPDQDPNQPRQILLERMGKLGAPHGFRYAEGFRRLET